MKRTDNRAKKQTALPSPGARSSVGHALPSVAHVGTQMDTHARSHLLLPSRWLSLHDTWRGVPKAEKSTCFRCMRSFIQELKSSNCRLFSIRHDVRNATRVSRPVGRLKKNHPKTANSILAAGFLVWFVCIIPKTNSTFGQIGRSMSGHLCDGNEKFMNSWRWENALMKSVTCKRSRRSGWIDVTDDFSSLFMLMSGGHVKERRYWITNWPTDDSISTSMTCS